MPRPTLFSHRKFLRLSAILGMPKPHVLGHLEYLWQSAYQAASAAVGDAIDVELAAEWNGKPGEFAAALLSVGFIEEEDGVLIVHDFWTHCPRYVKQRAETEEKLRSAGKTLSDIRREAGQKGAIASKQAANRAGLPANREDLTAKSAPPFPSLPSYNESTHYGCETVVSPPSSLPLKTRKTLPQKTMTLDEPVEPALKIWIDRFAAYVLEATGHELENMQRQTTAALALIRNRGHTVEELNKILDVILRSKNNAGFRWYGANMMSIQKLNTKTKDGSAWRSHVILAQYSDRQAYSRENPAPGSREAMDLAMDKAMENQPLPF